MPAALYLSNKKALTALGFIFPLLSGCHPIGNSSLLQGKGVKRVAWPPAGINPTISWGNDMMKVRRALPPLQQYPKFLEL